MRRSVFASMLFSMVLMAQAPRDVAPLKYWPAPLYWQPTRSETLIAAKPEFLGNASNPPAQTPANSLVFVGMTPCRVADTRTGFGFTGAFGPPSLAGNATRSFPIQASTTCAIPSIAEAYSFNITVVPTGPMYYLTIWPMGESQPNVSTLNDLPGTVIANAAIVPAGSDSPGSVNVFVSNNTDVIIDINGYYALQTGITLTQGMAGAPSLSFSGDAGTGIYSSASGVVNIAASGLPALSVGGSANNTALGIGALSSNTTGFENTAVGFGALQDNTSAEANTALGFEALNANTTGSNNTALGEAALVSNMMGTENTASGSQALFSNKAGNENTASGFNALVHNQSGNDNTAHGAFALEYNSTASDNTAVGFQALQNNTTGGNNTAVGIDALQLNQSGIDNIAIGSAAAYLVSSNGSYNIHIGNQGSAGDDHTIKIGTQGTQATAFIAGIYGAAASDGAAVFVNSNGQLGTASSSRRYKENIQDMGDASSGLLKLRPVTFRYKQPYADGSKPIDYGLIAEEVAEVYPDLVVKNADGQIETVQYQKLTPMLLNELQKQAAKTEALAAQQREQITAQQDLIQKLESRLAAVEALLAGPAPAAQP